MNKARLDVESITVETFTVQAPVVEAMDTPICTRWITCTNCPDDTCIC